MLFTDSHEQFWQANQRLFIGLGFVRLLSLINFVRRLWLFTDTIPCSCFDIDNLCYIGLLILFHIRSFIGCSFSILLCIRAHDSSFTWRHTGASSKTFNNNNNNVSGLWRSLSICSSPAVPQLPEPTLSKPADGKGTGWPVGGVYLISKSFAGGSVISELGFGPLKHQSQAIFSNLQRSGSIAVSKNGTTTYPVKACAQHE